MSDTKSNVISLGINAKDEVPPPPHPLADIQLTPEEWLARFVELNNVSYDYKTASLRQGEDSMDPKLLLSQMRLATYRYDMPHLRAFLKDALSLWMREKAKDHLSALRERLRFVACEQDLIEQWVVAVTNKADSCDIAVAKHFVWQIRRKLFGLSVEHHMMPVLYGASGGGKSVAVHKLLGPLESVTVLQNMTVFNDQFSRQMFAKNFVMFFDELAKSKQVDVNSLKNIITAPRVEWRGIQSETINSAPQNCTFIGCSNDPLRDRIQDPTSTRRFWQINCSDLLNWEVINSIDYMAMWRSVAENGPCPLISSMEQIRAVQENELRSRNPIEDWVLACCRKSDSPGEGLTTSELYKEFKTWHERGNNTAISIQKFSKDFPRYISTLLPEIKPTHSYRGTVWPLQISEQTNQLQR